MRAFFIIFFFVTLTNSLPPLEAIICRKFKQ